MTDQTDIRRLVAEAVNPTWPSTVADLAVADQLLAQFLIFPRRHHREKIALTRREAEILPLIAQGLTNGEIGTELALSANTVKTHAKRLHAKLRARNRTALVVEAIRAGMLEI